MKEYIVHAPNDKLCAIEEYTSFYGEPIKELVRCKDCKWFGNIGCAISIVDDTDKPSENDYCSFAERKERLIDEQPTIDAVPFKWIVEYAIKCDVVKRDVIGDMLKAWLAERKEE